VPVVNQASTRTSPVLSGLSQNHKTGAAVLTGGEWPADGCNRSGKRKCHRHGA
jgi:hypothetical protein